MGKNPLKVDQEARISTVEHLHTNQIRQSKKKGIKETH